MTDEGRTSGRQGLAAVMGSKQLKVVAVRGKGRVPITDMMKFVECRKKALDAKDLNPRRVIVLRKGYRSCFSSLAISS